MPKSISKLKDNINNNYYKAYEKRYRQVYEHNYLWSSKEPTPEVIETINNENILINSKILELGCGEGRDAIFLLNKNYNVTAIDYSDIINDTLKDTFDFIYSVAVIHMFVNETHRKKFYSFIYEHLKTNGIALIVSMGDGINEYNSDISKSFSNVERVVINNCEKISIAATSCKIVNWCTFEQEILNNNLIIKKKWISNKIPEFNLAMCVIVCRSDK